jgi:hypothetical protein
MSSKLELHKQGEDMANKDKIIDKIEKKIDSIEKLHDKESMMCEEVKDLLADLRDQEEDEKWEDDSGEDFDSEDIDDEDIDEEEDK